MGSIDESLRAILARVGGRTYADDEPAGMIAARIVDRLHGRDGGENVPEFFALVSLGYWLADMVAFFGGTPVSEKTPEVAAQLLGVLRGGDGLDEARSDSRYPGDILADVAALMPALEDIERRKGPQVV